MKRNSNHRQVMQDAWARYREWHSFKEAIYGPRKFDRIEFAQKLAAAWASAKARQMTAAQCQQEAIKAEIAALPFKSAHIDIEPRRRQLEAQLTAIAA